MHVAFPKPNLPSLENQAMHFSEYQTSPVFVSYLSGQNESGANKNKESEKWRQRNMCAARKKNVWKEQLVDPQID